MASPIKQLLNPRILFPLSPVAAAKNKITSPIQTHLTSDSSLAKTLTFQASSKNFNIKDLSTQNVDKRCNIKVKVTDYSNDTLMINTPNKTSIMKNGLNSTKNLNILGKGSFGTVVRGMYKGVNVAVKIVKLNENNLTSLKESNALHLHHENVTKVIDIIHSANTNYGIIVMEYLKFSCHLQSILDDRNVDLCEQTIIKYGLDVCNGLFYCHEKGVLHLDIKPSNILVSEDGLCQLCDFGNSVKIDEVNSWDGRQCTVAYAAPEILMGKPPTTKCDVYSLGILLWQMKYRESPYQEFDGIEVIIYKVVKFDCRPNVPLESVPNTYSSIYTSCWRGDPEDRPYLSSIINLFNNTLMIV